ncbi:MAG: hypothetical protein ABI467_19210 [Kofleriaceae bacterium]
MSYAHTKTTRAVLRSLVPVICPAEAAGLADAIIDHMELTFGVVPPLLGTAIHAGFAAYDLGALPRYRKRARALAAEAAERYYQSWEHGLTPVHVQFAHMINQLMSLACYEQPAMTERIGYRPGPWIEKVRHKRLTVFADDVAKQQAQILAPDPLRPLATTKQEVA